ncbi:polysaccharide biosynthesis protein [bacterium D16-76]|nr:polysaccharide biosynthesis protein [bacterium D16-76]
MRGTGKEKAGGQSFLWGALVLTAGMAVVKVIGALFKVPLQRIVGEYGMGLFNVAYNFYGPIFSLATAGFPVAVSRLVSESASLGRWKDVGEIKKAAMPLFLGAGAAGTIAITLCAPFYCRYAVGSPQALLPMLALAPAVLFACGGAVYRGYFAGLGDMAPTAVSEVAEAAIKLALGLWCAGALARAGGQELAQYGTVFGILPESRDAGVFLVLAFGAAGAILGVTAGSLGSLLYLWARYGLRGRVDPRIAKDAPPAAGRREIRRRLLKITLPVAAGSVAMNAGGLIDATFLQNRLQDIMAIDPEGLLGAYGGMIPSVYRDNPGSVPTFLYGCYTMALTLYLLVPAITQAFGVSALPAVTQAWTERARTGQKALEARMASVLRLTGLFCFPAGLGLTALSAPIVEVLYGGGPSAPVVAGVLRVLGPASLLTALSTPLASMLQAVGRADLPVKALAGAMGLKIAINWVLCGVPEINLMGAGVGTLLSYLFLVGLEIAMLQKAAGVRLRVKALLGPAFGSALLCAGGAWAGYTALARALPGREVLCLGAAVALGAVLYLWGALQLGAVTAKDIRMVPGGQKIAKTLEKWGGI